MSRGYGAVGFVMAEQPRSMQFYWSQVRHPFNNSLYLTGRFGKIFGDLEVKMLAHAYGRAEPQVQELRKAAGIYLRELRERKGLSQRALANLVGAEYYTLISQLETGRGRVPQDRYEDWANALDVDIRSFVKKLLSFYDPITYRILFGSEPGHE